MNKYTILGWISNPKLYWYSIELLLICIWRSLWPVFLSACHGPILSPLLPLAERYRAVTILRQRKRRIYREIFFVVRNREWRRRKDAFKSRGCFQKHSKETFVPTGHENLQFVLVCCTLYSGQMSVWQLIFNMFNIFNPLESGTATDLSGEQGGACGWDSGPST